MGGPATRHSGRASALAIVAALICLVAAVSGYARLALFDSDSFAERATAALDDEAVRAEIATRVTDDLVLAADADLVGVRPVIESAAEGLVSAGFFQDIFEAAARDLHRGFFRADRNSVTLTIADVGEVVRGALQALEPRIAKRIPGGADAALAPIEPPSWAATLARVGHDLAWIAIGLAALALALLAAALWISPDRRRTVLSFGLAAIVGAVALAVALGIARSLVLAQVADSGTRDALAGIWDAFLGDLADGLYLLAACGAVIAAAASSLLRPIDVADPLRRAWAAVTVQPEREWLRAVRALALVALGILVIADRDTALDLAVLAVGLYAAYAGVAELMRLTIAPGDERPRQAELRSHRRALAAAGIAAAVIVAVGAAFVSLGGTSEEARAIATEGCNGSRDLCDRPLDEVAIVATHNAMSAVTNEDWLFGQQDAGLPEQLREGVRGLLIDAHYGQPTESGLVQTDLSEVGVGERDAYAETLGPRALDAALRLRDRVVASPVTGPRRIYLCHRFCELGSIPIEKAFRQIRDFLAANPYEAIVVVIEDYVDARDIAAAVEASGLIDYVYTGPVDPLPTLGEMTESGGQALMLAENDAGGGEIPWYHAGYESLVQETPFSFAKPAELVGEAALKASCKPNRGPGEAPLFLLNHWIDTSPTPRPSNAGKVNAREALLGRIRECERRRGLSANLIAVDFYREGDVFDVVEELNSRPD